MNSTTFKYLNFVDFKKIDKWYVSYYVNPHKIDSNFNLIKLKNIIVPEKIKITKKQYDGSLDIISKISFADGKIHIRPDRKTGMDLYLLKIGHLLVSKINFHQGALAINKISDLVCSTHYQPYNIIYKEILDEYLIMVLRANKFQDFLGYLRADGIKNEATYEFIKELEIPLPSLQEQKKLIEDYQNKIQLAEKLEKEANNLKNELDSQLGISNNKIESNIGKLNFVDFKLIEKWGLDQIFKSHTKYNGKFKTVKVIEICNVGSGGTPSRNNKSYYNGNIPWIKTGEVIDEIIVDTEEKITSEAIKNSSAKLYPKGSLIVAMYGQGKTRGRTAKLGIDATTNQACAVLFNINNEIVITDYLWIYLMNEYDRMRELATGNNQPNLNADMIKNYPVVIPPMDIQLKIIEEYNIIKNKQNQNLQNAEALRKEAIINFENAIFN